MEKITSSQMSNIIEDILQSISALKDGYNHEAI